MKYLATIALLMFLGSCAQPDSENDQMNVEPVSTSEEEPSLDGTWEMINYFMYENDQITDTVTMNEGYRQVKMYHDGHVMWSRKVPSDSAQLFGYGTYMIDGSTFSENLEYGSHYMMGILDSMRIFDWRLEIGDDYYTQTEMNEEGQKVYAENYRRIE